MTPARLSDAELQRLEAGADPKLAGLAAEVRRLRQLLLQVYPFVTDVKGSEELQAELEREVAEIRAAHRSSQT